MTYLDSTLGAAFLGGIAAAILYGLTSVQTFIYFQNKPRDGRLFRAMILLLWIWDSLHLAVTIHAMYWYLIINFGKLESLAYPVWSIVAGNYFTNLSDLVVRGVYSHRVYILCGRQRKVLRIVLPAIIMMLSFLVFVCGVAFASYAFELKTFKQMNKVSVLLYISFSTAVAADFAAAISLCALLYDSRTGIKGTDSLLSLLMAFIINTGLLTSFCAIACLVTYALWPSRFIFLGLYFPLSKLYVNSLLASLNARKSLRFTHRSTSFNTAATPRPHRGDSDVSTNIMFPMKATNSTYVPTRHKAEDETDSYQTP